MGMAGAWVLGLLGGVLVAGVPFKTVFHTKQFVVSDCEYSDWTQWSPCSAACGVTGFSSRSRVVLAEPAGYGYHKGEGCDTSSLEEWRDCLGPICAADCQMSDWSDWGACSADCGAGIRARARDVLAEAVGDGAACGFTDQTQDCNSGPCAQDCVLGDWAPWSACPSCGQGSRSRRRSIATQGAFGGRVCDFTDLTESEACFNNPCPVDCVMDQWSSWTACSADCGQGSRSRTRQVRISAAFGGLQCGPAEEWETCDNGPCARDCILADWAPWSSCPACGQASRSRSRSIIEQGAFGGIQCDFSSLSESESCNNRPCAVDCVMEEWSAWSFCSNDCGEGRRQRLRSVRIPSAYGGRSCQNTEEWQSCNNGPCARDCVLSDWAEWSSCPACGQASRSRSRSIVEQGAFGGIQCDFSSLSESESCNSRPCAVDCVMDQWSAWSQCTSQCGPGRRDRSRSVRIPSAYGGRSCEQTQEWEACDNGPCARDCVLGDWASWSACPACGQASRSRRRSILEQGAFGGIQCDFTDLSESESCNNRPCAVDCVMEFWSAWSQCSSNCGSGRRDRSRSVRSQAAYGGKPCGPTSDWEACNNGPCVRDCVMGSWSQWSKCCDAGVRTRWRQISQQPSGPSARPCDSLDETEKCTPPRFPPPSPKFRPSNPPVAPRRPAPKLTVLRPRFQNPAPIPAFRPKIPFRPASPRRPLLTYG